MPTRSDKRHLYIELRSGSGHNRHRFVRRHSTSQTPTKKADNNHHHHQPNPMRLGWSFSIATSSEQPSHALPTKKTRKRHATMARATSEAETERTAETCRRTDAVRVDRGAPDVFTAWGWGCVRDWRATGDEDESVDVGERRRRRRGHHHRHHHHCCPCRPLLRSHVFYQPVMLFDNSQVQNNYYDYARGECRPECAAYRDVKDKDDDVHHLLPHLDRLSLTNGHDERASSPPPAYSDVCPRETDTPFVGHGAEFRHLAECQQVHDELDSFGRVQDWLLH
ncbi:hypothetical protein HDK77DRAFT_426697 [Phyllosticta capitalensis]